MWFRLQIPVYREDEHSKTPAKIGSMTMYPQAHLSLTPRPAKGSRQAVMCRTTSREFHPNCRSDRAAPIA